MQRSACLTLVILAAGLSSRYQGLKQLDGIGPRGELLLDYALYDANRAGFSRHIIVVRPELEARLAKHIAQQFQGALEITYAQQQLGSLPSGFTPPVSRTKPWGTGHAVISVAHLIDGPFAVCNADDFYGSLAYRQLAEHLRRSSSFAVIGYQLADTVSEFGGVSRAVCTVRRDGLLERLVEVTDIRRGIEHFQGLGLDGKRYELRASQPVSTNLWGLSTTVFPLLRRRFTDFLTEHGEDHEVEFVLSSAMNELIANSEARVQIVPTHSPWLGVTHPGDRGHVANQVRNFVARGDYPRYLGTLKRER